MKTIARRGPDLVATCVNAAWRVFLAGIAFDSCVRYSAEDARREGFEAIAIEDTCRGIDIDGSMAAARELFRALGIRCISAETVDNALDACEEAGILPDINVQVRDRYGKSRVIVEDNGPGIVESQIARIFGKLLYGSKFHKLSQSRGQQGMGISAAGMYGQLTTSKPLHIISRTKGDKLASEMRVSIDTAKKPAGHPQEATAGMGSSAWNAGRDGDGGPLSERTTLN